MARVAWKYMLSLGVVTGPGRLGGTSQTPLSLSPESLLRGPVYNHRITIKAFLIHVVSDFVTGIVVHICFLKPGP